MGILDPIKPEILAVKFIPNVSEDLKRDLKLAPEQRSIGMFTCKAATEAFRDAVLSVARNPKD